MSVRIDALSTNLGHEDVSETYWYLSGTPELLAIATKRLHGFADEDVEGSPCHP